MADSPSKAQQRAVGIPLAAGSSENSGSGCGPILEGISGGAASGMRGSGCVFFSCTMAGGLGKRPIRTVSFFGPDAMTIESGGIRFVPDRGGIGRCGNGGRAGKSIRIVSEPGAESSFGGIAVRTVSFLGSMESDMSSSKSLY